MARLVLLLAPTPETASLAAETRDLARQIKAVGAQLDALDDPAATRGPWHWSREKRWRREADRLLEQARTLQGRIPAFRQAVAVHVANHPSARDVVLHLRCVHCGAAVGVPVSIALLDRPWPCGSSGLLVDVRVTAEFVTTSTPAGLVYQVVLDPGSLV